MLASEVVIGTELCSGLTDWLAKEGDMDCAELWLAHTHGWRLVALLMGLATTCFLVRATALETRNMHKPGPSRCKWMALHHRHPGQLNDQCACSLW